MTRARRIRWAIAAVFLATVSGVGALWWRAAQSSTAVSPADALDTFRDAPSVPASTGAPKPGVYTYRASGSEAGGVGALEVGRKLPPIARFVVTPVPGGWEGEMLYSQEHIEASRYVRGSDGALRVTWHRTKLTFAGIGRDDRRDVAPPSLVIPADLTPGRTWSDRYRTGDINVASKNTIARAEQVKIGEAAVDAVVIETRSTTDGPHPGTRNETMWWAPALNLPVRWDVEMNIGGTFGFKGRSSVHLTSPTPAI